MNRLFKDSLTRHEFSLSGLWDIAKDAAAVGKTERWFENFPQSGKRLCIPCCWECDPDLFGYVGDIWYRTRFETAAKNIKLTFEAVQNECDVYLDGQHIGYHYGGFVEFSYIIRDLQPGVHELVMRVNNVNDTQNTIPLTHVDWYHYGGIIRDVVVTEIGSELITGYRLSYELDDALQNAKLKLELDYEVFADTQTARAFEFLLDGKVIYSAATEPGEKSVSLTGIIDNVELWDTENPRLYNVTLQLGADSVCDRIGFRKVEAKARKIWLNGKPILLKGVNRHEEHPDWGFAVPFMLIKRDIDIIRSMGCNVIRGSHYPNTKRTLDYCDETGMLFWEEIPMWGFHSDECLTNPLILERGLRMHEEMVTRDLHHPSIIIWGMHNEMDTRKEAANVITKAFTELVRSMDSSRLLTYATMFPEEDIGLAYCDIVSINKYYGWYGEDISQWPAFLQRMDEKLANEGLSDLPIFISEFGAGGIYGNVTFEDVKWTETYQNEFFEGVMPMLYDAQVAGTFVWQYCDIRSSNDMALSRPRSFNNKGLVNEYRKPKMAFFTMKKIYQAH